MLADALLRSVAGTTALLRVTGANTDTSMSELGLVATTFAEVAVSPVVMRKLRPTWQGGGESKWELLVSALLPVTRRRAVVPPTLRSKASASICGAAVGLRGAVSLIVHPSLFAT